MTATVTDRDRETGADRAQGNEHGRPLRQGGAVDGRAADHHGVDDPDITDEQGDPGEGEGQAGEHAPGFAPCREEAGRAD